jgi:hypothetical protein
MSERREMLTVTLAMLALSVANTYPLVRQIGSALPINLGDPLLNTFILGWDADRIQHGFQALWDAPFYFPMRNTLALSEHLLGIAIFTAPIQWMTGNAVLVYNVALLASTVLAGVGAYLLTRSLWGRRDAAWVGALAFACAPHRAMHASHLQVLVSGWMPIALWGLHRYFTTWSRRALAVFALAFVAQAWSNLYYMLFLGVTIAGVGAAELGRYLRARWTQVKGSLPAAGRVLLDIGVAAAGIGVALAPIGLAYQRALVGRGLHRNVGEMANCSAVAFDYLRIPPSLWLWTGHLRFGEAERGLYPGVIVMVLAVIGMLSGLRGVASAGEGRPERWRWYVALYATLAGFGIWMTFGPAVAGPYAGLLRIVPGFDGLRVPARFVVVVALALAVLGSAGAAWVLAWLRPRLAVVATILVGAAIALDGYGGPLTMVPFDASQRTRSDLNAWLRSAPEGGVLELPIVMFEFAPLSLTYQYNTLLHQHPVVNGYSGYGSGFQDYLSTWASPLKERDEIGAVLRGLRSINVRYIVLHRDVASLRPELGWSDPDALVQAIDGAVENIAERRQFGATIAWRLAAPAPSPPFDTRGLVALPAREFRATASANPDLIRYAFDGKIDTRWHSGKPQFGGEWMRLAFDRDVDVGRLVFTTPQAGIGNHPRELVVESEAIDGARTILYTGSVMPYLIGSLANASEGTPVVLDVPSNRTRTLWLRQAGRTTSWYWTVPELTVFERKR